MYRGLNRIDSFPSGLAVLQSLSIHVRNLGNQVTDLCRAEQRAGADEAVEPSKCVTLSTVMKNKERSFIYTYCI